MTSSSPLNKRPRLSRDEARTALLAAGKRLLVARGLDTGLGLVTLNDAIVESGVPRASAYRVYAEDDIDPQVAFRIELLTSYIEGDPLQSRREVAQAIADETLAEFDTTDPRKLAAALREIIRVGAGDNLASLSADPNWKIIGPSLAVTGLSDWAPEELVAAHRGAVMASIEAFTPLYKVLGKACGLRLTQPFTWEMMGLFAAQVAATVTFHSKCFPELQEIMRPTGPGGELQPWSQNAILVEGIVRLVSEPDPDAEVSADLSAWD